MDTDHMLLEYKNTNMVLLSHCTVKTSYTEHTASETDKWTTDQVFWTGQQLLQLYAQKLIKWWKRHKEQILDAVGECILKELCLDNAKA